MAAGKRGRVKAEVPHTFNQPDLVRTDTLSREQILRELTHYHENRSCEN